MNEEIVERLIKLRRSNGYSQQELANVSGVSKSTISRIERGIMSPDVRTLEKLANTYNMILTIKFEKEE